MGDDTPKKSGTELALEQLQLKTLQQEAELALEQIRQQNLLQPLILDSIGLEQVTDAKGKAIGFKNSGGKLQSQREAIEAKFLERTEAALEGRLPVNPALLGELKTEEELLENTLRKQFGADFSSSSPAIEQINRQKKRHSDILEGARRGDLTLAESLGIARQGANQGGINFQNQTALQALQRQDPLAQVLQGALGVQRGFQFDRQLAANTPNPFGAIVGSLGGMAAGSMFGAVGSAAGGALGSKLFG